MRQVVFLFILIFIFNASKSQNSVNKDSSKPCIGYVECNDTNPKLYAFIGKKISLRFEMPKYCNVVSMDNRAIAKYKILKNIQGNFNDSIIDFYSYRHGIFKPLIYTPNKIHFNEFETVLLYVADYCGEMIHIKYTFDDLYETKDNLWASPSSLWMYKQIDSILSIKPHRIEYKEPIEYGFETRNLDLIKVHFPEPYFKIIGNKVIAEYGYYPDELFEIKKEFNLRKRTNFKY